MIAENKILLIEEVAQEIRLSKSSINRLLRQARRGESTFPLPISAIGCKGRWFSADILRWLQSQSIATSPVPPTDQQKRGNSKAFKEHDEQVDRGLDRFRSKR